MIFGKFSSSYHPLGRINTKFHVLEDKPKKLKNSMGKKKTEEEEINRNANTL